MANNSIYAAFQQMWLHITSALGAKADATALDTKVDKVSGKGLSTNDYTTDEKNKLAGIAAGATANTGTITGVTGGNGLTGSATSGAVTLAVGQGNGISVAADAISVKAGTGITVNSSGVNNAGVRSIAQDGTDGHKLTINTGGTNATITIPDNDTTYSEATTSAAGLMSAADKTKFNYTNIAYGTCSTAAATVAKVITVSGNTNWSLTAGSTIVVLFSATNTAKSPTFNVNGTGAKNVYYGASQITTSNLSYAGYASRPMIFIYDGTQYRFVGWGYDGNSDTKVTQTITTTNAEYPLLASTTANASSTATTTSRFATGVTLNPANGSITATSFIGTATQATQDGSGNVISSTYATKSEVPIIEIVRW